MEKECLICGKKKKINYEEMIYYKNIDLNHNGFVDCFCDSCASKEREKELQSMNNEFNPFN